MSSAITRMLVKFIEAGRVDDMVPFTSIDLFPYSVVVVGVVVVVVVVGVVVVVLIVVVTFVGVDRVYILSKLGV